MNAPYLMKLAASEAPELLKKTKTAAELAQRLDPMSAQQIFAEFDEILSHAEGKAKTAGWWRDVASRSATSATNAIPAAVGVAATGLGLAVATDLYNAARRGLSSGRNWKRMIEVNPELREKDQALVRRNFNALQRTAPDLAADPLAAGAAVFNLLNVAEGGYHRVITDIAKMQKDRVEARYEPFKGLKPPQDAKSESAPRTTGDRKSHSA